MPSKPQKQPSGENFTTAREQLNMNQKKRKPPAPPEPSTEKVSFQNTVLFQKQTDFQGNYGQKENPYYKGLADTSDLNSK